MRKKLRDTASVTSSLYSSTGESGLTGGTRVNVTSKKCITKKQKYIKPTDLSPFLPWNKRILNEDKDDNPETTDTSLFGKYDMSHTSPDDFTEKTNDKKIKNNGYEYKEETSKIKEGNEIVDNYETSDTLNDDSIINTKKKRSIDSTVEGYEFQISCIHSVIYIVPLCGGKW